MPKEIKKTDIQKLRAATLHQWNIVDEDTTDGIDNGDRTERMAVPGGWLYRTLMWDPEPGNPEEIALAMVFVPESANVLLAGKKP